MVKSSDPRDPGMVDAGPLDLRSVSIQSRDLSRLREIMRQAETRLDETSCSETELDALEVNLERSIRKQVNQLASEPSVDLEAQQRNWQKLQLSLFNARTSPAKVLDLNKRRQPQWIYLSGLAAAICLGVLMVSQLLPTSSSIKNSSETYKGSIGDRSAADCEYDVRAQDGTVLSVAADGGGFLGPLQTRFELSVLCQQAGFLHVEVNGTETKLIRNIPLSAGLRQSIAEAGKAASFVIEAPSGWNISLILTEHEISSDQTWASLKSEDGALNAKPILWQDSFAVRGLQ